MLGRGGYWSGISSGVPIYANVAAFPISAANGQLAVDQSTGNLYEFNGATWVQIGGPGAVFSIGNLDSQAANAKGLALVSNVLSTQSADATHPGLVNTTTQSFAGQKTFTSPIVGTQTQGDSSTKAASTAYVDVAVANAVSGVNPAVAVQAATTAASDTSSFTYNNGASGIGATLTGVANTALTVDGYTFTALGQRLLVKNDTQSPSGAFNGIYYVTQVQAAILPLILTRALDFDMPSDMNNTGAIPVINGTVNGTTSWVLTSQVVTVGTTPLTFTIFTKNPSSYLLASNNLSDVANKTTSFNNLSPMTTLGDIIYGGASGAGTRLGIGSGGNALVVSGGIPAWGPVVTSVGFSVPASSIFGTSGSPVTSSGTLGLTVTGTSGGIPYFDTTSTLSSSGLLTNHAIVLGGGAGAAPTVLASLGTTTTVLHGNASGAPTFGAVSLTADVSGVLPTANGGTGTGTTLTSGSVVFADVSGNYSQDNSNFFWDVTNHRLCIGNTSSSSLLTVGDNFGLSTSGYKAIALGNTSGNSMFTIGQDATHNLQYRWDYNATASAAIVNLVTFGYNNPIRIDSSILELQSQSGGFVGIGTTSPSSLLGIAGSKSVASWTTTGACFGVYANTQTDTTGSGTIATRVASSFAQPTFASSSAVTLTTAANVYIADAPAAGTSTTITNAYALYVASGASFFTGAVSTKAGVLHVDPASTNAVTITSPSLAGSYTLTLPNAQGGAGSIPLNDGSGNLSWVSMRSGIQPCTIATRDVAVLFSSAMPSANYSIDVSFINTTDNNPDYQPYVIVSRTTSGFTAEVNNNFQTGAYSMLWRVTSYV